MTSPVDIGMVSYRVPGLDENGWRLNRAIEAIKAQTFQDWRMFIASQMPEDEEIVKAHSADQRIHWLPQQGVDIGTTALYNRLINRTEAEFYLCAAWDDWYEPEFLATALKMLLENDDAVIAYARTKLVNAATGELLGFYDKDLEYTDENRWIRWFDFLYTQDLLDCVHGLFRMSALRKCPRGFKPWLGTNVMDTALICRLLLLGKILVTDRPLYNRSRALTTPPTIQDRHKGIADSDEPWRKDWPLRIPAGMIIGELVDQIRESDEKESRKHQLIGHLLDLFGKPGMRPDDMWFKILHGDVNHYCQMAMQFTPSPTANIFALKGMPEFAMDFLWCALASNREYPVFQFPVVGMVMVDEK
jgi:hypothetical protein